MKQLFYALASLALLAGYTAQAQAIPNGGLETWAARNGKDSPTNWQTTDDFYASYYGTFNTGTTTKATDVHGGTYAAKMTNVQLQDGNNPPFVQEAYLAAGSTTGRYALGGIPLGSGVPTSTRPAQLQFFYKNTGVVSDTAALLVVLTQTPRGSKLFTTIGIRAIILPPVATYTAVTLPIQYDPTKSATPDTAYVVFTSGLAATLGTTGGLFIDDVSFSGTALATRADATTQAMLTVAPNPSPGGRFVISSPDKPELAAAPLQVMDALGRTVVQQAAQAAPSGQRELDLSSFSTGIYSLRLDSKQGPIVRQLTVK